MLGLTTAVLRILLWPVRVFISFLFPFGETDGLSAAVTEKAAQQFVSYLRSVVGTPASSAWSTSGFASVKQQAIADQSLILLYLHSPLHHQSRTFCQQVLSQDPILSWIQTDQVIATGVSIHTGQGAHLQNLLGIDVFPALAVLQPRNNALQLVFSAQGFSRIQQDLLPHLQLIQQEHQAALVAQETERLRREQDEQIMRNTDTEYEASLAADRERERIQAEERQAELVKQEAEQKEKAEAEQALQRARDMVLPEPASGGAMIRFCLPTGAKVNRRFTADQTIGSLKAFVRVHCVDNAVNMGGIGLSTNFPRKTYEDDDVTLVDADLVPQAVIMVQDLDA